MNRNMNWYLENNDFEGAKERLENTTGRWVKQWFAVCAEIFKRNKELCKKYVLNPIDYTIKKICNIVTKRLTKYSESIQIIEGVDLLDSKENKCYLFTFYDENDNMICSKIGTTTRKVLARLKEELKSSTYKEMGCTKAVINRVYDCKEFPPEGLESYFRSMYILKYPESFQKNDRFMRTFFDLAEADKIVEEYFKMA